MATADDPQPPQSAPRRRRRLALAALATAIPLVPIGVGLSMSSGATVTASAPAMVTFNQAPATPPSAPRTTAPGHAGALVALLRHATALRAAPAGRALAPLGLRTGFGSPQALLVVATRPGWLGVLSPLAGNGHVGWVPRGAVTLGRVDWRIEVSLIRKQITVLEGGRRVARYHTAIGTTAAPTPTGRFAVTDRLLTGDPSGPYGCCILALSAHAPHAIQGWGGGDRIAIHATTATATIGTAASHGCLRLDPADARWLLDHIPLGTPVVIRA
jgi:lipoprotein-anchoring transpeptidase ErfK/SrfK